MDKDEQADAQTLYNVVQALSLALSGNFISLEAAVNFLAKYVDTMEEWDAEKKRIEEMRLLNMPIEESYTQKEQALEIDDELQRNGGGEAE